VPVGPSTGSISRNTWVLHAHRPTNVQTAPQSNHTLATHIEMEPVGWETWETVNCGGQSGVLRGCPTHVPPAARPHHALATHI